MGGEDAHGGDADPEVRGGEIGEVQALRHGGVLPVVRRGVAPVHQSTATNPPRRPSGPVGTLELVEIEREENVISLGSTVWRRPHGRRAEERVDGIGGDPHVRRAERWDCGVEGLPAPPCPSSWIRRGLRRNMSSLREREKKMEWIRK